jgi:chromosome segregation ATPase
MSIAEAMGIVGALIGLYAALSSAKKSEVEALSGIIDKLNEELKRREAAIIELERQIAERDEMIAELRNDLEDVQRWADDLVQQVESLSAIPVKMRRRRKNE